MKGNFIMRKIALIAVTPFHMFNAINLKMSEFCQDEVDLYILKGFQGSEEYKAKIEEKQLFRKVTFITRPELKSPWDKVKRRLVQITGDLSYYTEVKDMDYDIVGFSIYETFNMILIKNIIDRNKEAKVILLEDGMESYTLRKRKFSTNLMWRIWGIKIDDYLREQWLYKPELRQKETGNLKLCQTPVPSVEVLATMNSIFNGEELNFTQVNPSSILYFDQPLEETDWGVGRKDIIEVLVKYLGTEEFLVKRHPRKQDFDYGRYNVALAQDIGAPWELISGDVKDKVLIAFNSTAVFTPLFVHNNVNKVVLLYRYFMKGSALSDEWDAFFNGLKEVYPEMVFIPETEEEIKAVFENGGERDV